METVLVAVDFSEITDKLLDEARSFAKCCGCKVHLLHVAAPDPAFVGYHAGPPGEQNARIAELKSEKNILEQLAKDLRMSGIEVLPLLMQGVTSDILVQEVYKLKPRLLIMGTHGRGYTDSVLLGSTSHEVIRRISCPVLLFPFRKR